jgi:predicted RNase H-like HicB family nuclease
MLIWESQKGMPPAGRTLPLREVAMKYTVLIEESHEGFAVSVPGLPGCHSQGDTEAEALANIADAIREYLDVLQELARSAGGKQAEVEV